MDKGLFKGCTQFILLLLGLILLFVATGHGAITKLAGSKNSLGSVIEYTNPNIYLLGAIEGGEVIKDPAGRLYTLLTVQPAETFALYTEQLFLLSLESIQLFLRLDFLTGVRISHLFPGLL